MTSSHGSYGGSGHNGGQTSQTLARGLEVLEILADRPGGLTVVELAATLGLHRAVVSRLIRTLEAYGYIERVGERGFRLGTHIVELAGTVSSDVRRMADPLLRALADDLGTTTVLLVRSGSDAVVISVIEPQGSDLHLSFRLGSRHALDVGAEGMAMLAGSPPVVGERPEVTAGRANGYVVSSGEVHPGTWGLAVPVSVAGRPAEISVGVISPIPLEVARVAPAVRRLAANLAGRLTP